MLRAKWVGKLCRNISLRIACANWAWVWVREQLEALMGCRHVPLYHLAFSLPISEFIGNVACALGLDGRDTVHVIDNDLNPMPSVTQPHSKHSA